MQSNSLSLVMDLFLALRYAWTFSSDLNATESSNSSTPQHTPDVTHCCSQGAAPSNMRAYQGHDADSEVESDDAGGFSDVEEHWEEEEIGLEDEAALARFMNPEAASQQQRTLSDIIMERIREKQEAGGMPAIPEWVSFPEASRHSTKSWQEPVSLACSSFDQPL